jgi:hypothetical protein
MQSPPLSPLSPLASILIDLDRSIKAALYYPALLISLTLPEVCSALTVDNTVFIKEKHYADFVNKYAVGLGLNGVECYRLRGGVVHRGNLAGHPYIGVTNVVFTLPETPAGIDGVWLNVPDCAPPKKALILDLVRFCNAMVSSVHAWYREHHDHPKVIKNMENLIRYCPEGPFPFVGGAPVVASGD